MWWLDNVKIPYSDYDLYVDVERFKEFCKKLKVNPAYLGTYEKYKLIYPIYRVFRPKEYLQAIFEQKYNNPEQICIPDHYLMLFEIEDQISVYQLYRGAKFWNLINKGHLLDQACAQNNPFVRKLDTDSFVPRCKYRVNLIKKNGIKKEDYVVRDFYSPWQIYLLEEANRKFMTNVNVLKEFDEYKRSLKLHREFSPRTLSLIKWKDFFEAIWDYRFRENLLLLNFTLDKTGFFILEDKEAEKFYNECEKIAKVIALRFSYSQWIDFLKQLCALYFQYKDAEKIGLSECVKKDIRVIIDILMMTFGVEYRKIIENVGWIINGHKFFMYAPLERIFPEWETFLKKEAKSHLGSILENYNKVIPSTYHVSKDDLDQIIDYALNTNNELLLASLIGLNKEYFSSSSYLSWYRVWPYLTSLAISAVHWIKSLVNNHKIGLEKALNQITNKKFSRELQQVKQLFEERTGKIFPGYPDINDLIELSKIINEIENIDKDTNIKYLVLSYLIRNYVAHNVKITPLFFGGSLQIFVRALIYLVFYAWKVKNP